MGKIFLWGSYWQGNFGDDLMALIIGSELRALGYEVLLYRLPKELAGKYEFDSTSSIERGIKFCDCVVLGGGALFQANPPLISRIFRRPAAQINKIYSDILKFSLLYNRPIFCVSAGSDGVNNFSDMSPERAKLFSSDLFVGGTVRLEKDLALFEDRNNDICFFSDILFAAKDIAIARGMVKSAAFQLKKEGVIGLNISKRNKKFGDTFRNFYKNIIYIHTHSLESGMNSEYSPHGVAGQDVYINYDPIKTMCKISSFELIVSTKLHLGLVGLTMGVPFVSYDSRSKTRYQMNYLGLSEYVYEKDQVCSLLENVAKGSFCSALIQHDMLSELIEEEKLHIAYLDILIRKNACLKDKIA